MITKLEPVIWLLKLACVFSSNHGGSLHRELTSYGGKVAGTQMEANQGSRVTI